MMDGQEKQVFRELNAREKEARKHFCFALDGGPYSYDTVVGEIADLAGFFKVGSGLFSASAIKHWDFLDEIYQAGKKAAPNIYIDAKFHDTPDAVHWACESTAGVGIAMMSVHVGGGEAMVKGAVEGCRRGAESYASGFRSMHWGELGRPKVIGVTELSHLTSKELRKLGIRSQHEDLMKQRAGLARAWGLDGIVCEAYQVKDFQDEFGEDFTYVVQGIAWKGKAGAGHPNPLIPDVVMRDCKNAILVVGSGIAQSSDLHANAYEFLQAIGKELDL